jgi:glyoxylase-like metal-dependent hydrolase (beta-lactamase superfamily II)
MRELAPGLWRLPVAPNWGINAYLADGLLIDAGVRQVAPLLLRQLKARRPLAHVLTHAHPDHQGASHAICMALGLPLWCGAEDAAAMADGRIARLLPPSPANRLLCRLVGGPAHPVSRYLREGDRLGAWVVLETPGHSPGHRSFWRPDDGVLILGDVLAHQHPITQQVGLIEPMRRFTPDPAQNRASARRIAALRPRLVCFGHGPPLRDPERLARFVAGLDDGEGE